MEPLLIYFGLGLATACLFGIVAGLSEKHYKADLLINASWIIIVLWPIFLPLVLAAATTEIKKHFVKKSG